MFSFSLLVFILEGNSLPVTFSSINLWTRTIFVLSTMCLIFVWNLSTSFIPFILLLMLKSITQLVVALIASHLLFFWKLSWWLYLLWTYFVSKQIALVVRLYCFWYRIHINLSHFTVFRLWHFRIDIFNERSV